MGDDKDKNKEKDNDEEEDKSEVNKEDDKGHNEANDEEDDDNEKDDDEGDDEGDDEDDDNKEKDKEEDKRWSSFYLRRSTCSMEETLRLSHRLAIRQWRLLEASRAYQIRGNTSEVLPRSACLLIMIVSRAYVRLHKGIIRDI